MVLDVTNGIVKLRGLVIRLTILPRTIYIETKELVVTEGRDAALLPQHLHVITAYYADKIADYLLVDPPSSGWLVSKADKKKRRKKNVAIFSVADLADKSVEYVHDGSDTVSDSFSLVGRTASKTSVPTVVRVRVLPVNDEVPEVANNTGVDVWDGGWTAVSPGQLEAVDRDTPAARVAFKVLSGPSPSCVAVSLWPRRAVPVTAFTQDDVNKGRVILTHTGMWYEQLLSTRA